MSVFYYEKDFFIYLNSQLFFFFFTRLIIKPNKMNELDLEVRDELYKWLDSIPFSRPKIKLARYFADATAVAELINYCIPNFVYENAYPPCMSLAKKIDNWERLNNKVLSKLGIRLTKKRIQSLAEAKLEYTEAFLCELAGVIYMKNYFTIQRVLDKDKEKEKGDTRNNAGGTSNDSPLTRDVDKIENQACNSHCDKNTLLLPDKLELQK